MKAKFVQEIRVTDPDTNLDVDIAIYKLESGGMVGLDSSYLMGVDYDALWSPYDFGVEIEETDVHLDGCPTTVGGSCNCKKIT